MPLTISMTVNHSFVAYYRMRKNHPLSLVYYIKFYIILVMKAVIFHGTSLADIKNFPEDARKDVGDQLRFVQLGLDPADWKAMANIGQGVKEIRIREVSGQYRVIYVAKLADAIHVLHAFKKRVRKPAKRISAWHAGGTNK